MDERFSILPRSMKMRKDLSDSEKFLLSHIASFPDHCFQKIEVIAEELGWKERKVQRILYGSGGKPGLRDKVEMDIRFDGRTNHIRIRGVNNNTPAVPDLAPLTSNDTPAPTKVSTPEVTPLAPIDYKLEDKEIKRTIHAAPTRPKINNIIPPTLEMVQERIKETSSSVDPEAFFDFYQSKGWVVGKSKMKDWHAAIRTWERNRSAHKPDTGGLSGDFFPDEEQMKKLNVEIAKYAR
jgi:hypothetical protein